ncbi:AraC family ligand binding domain-containing protein [Lacticaseibacillus manihotivorans]|uniref:AraC-type arabinose-binding/dimerisation domain-containing protein n=2 Tax=Lacticaseibacillus manihotivorans TaxID=88233 RepID=A0A0R1QLK7_9LACO|nr:AraC family ligand binding domain-containing protein [Lacticaseibacillus manihotivorans]KRL45345.1 hypothetical protein FD01_GL000725 [Lacticaseibacillus manihotivorans DSM 13343 = JCM 12514]QFQ91666.1 hypothetical protein LM010_09615 [Lacticaseibacillus manihotivorans]
MELSQLDEILFRKDMLERLKNDDRKLRELTDVFKPTVTTYKHKALLAFSKTSHDQIEISKQPRGILIPEHIQDYVELSYVYHGNCQYLLNGQLLSFTTGSMVLIDQHVRHTMRVLGQADIVVNFIFDPKFISQDLIDQLVPESELQEFFLRASSHYSEHENFIAFAPDHELAQMVNLMLKEYYGNQVNSAQTIMIAMKLLLLVTSRLSHTQTNLKVKLPNRRSQVSYADIIAYVRENYQNVTFEFGMSISQYRASR